MVEKNQKFMVVERHEYGGSVRAFGPFAEFSEGLAGADEDKVRIDRNLIHYDVVPLV